MSSDLMRKYIDVLNENQKTNESQQLNEGMIMDIAKKASGWVLSKFAPEFKELAPIVQKATGGDMSLTKDNAAKVMNALGVSKDDVAALVQKAQSKDKSEPEISETVVGTIGKIILRIIWAVLVAGGGAVLAGLAGPLSMAAEGFWLLGGLFAIMGTQGMIDPNSEYTDFQPKQSQMVKQAPTPKQAMKKIVR